MNTPSADVVPSATGCCSASTRTSQAGDRLAGEAVRREHQHLAGRGLRHHADVRDHDDGVGAEAIVDGLDQVDAGFGDGERDAAELRIAMVRQQLAPRGDELVRVEQRHLREGVHVQLDALRGLDLVGGGAPVGAVLSADLRPREVAQRVALAALPVGEPLDPRLFLRNRHRFVGAELVRILQPAEERERVAHLVDAHVQLRHAAEGEEEMRRVPRREHLARRQREGRTSVGIRDRGFLRMDGSRQPECRKQGE